MIVLKRLTENMEVGRLIDTVKPDECSLNFHPENGMKENVSVLCLEQRYDAHKDEVYQILKNKQLYPEEKISEMAKLFSISESDAYESIFGSQDPKVQRRQLHRKMKKDLLGS